MVGDLDTMTCDDRLRMVVAVCGEERAVWLGGPEPIAMASVLRRRARATRPTRRVPLRRAAGDEARFACVVESEYGRGVLVLSQVRARWGRIACPLVVGLIAPALSPSPASAGDPVVSKSISGVCVEDQHGYVEGAIDFGAITEQAPLVRIQVDAAPLGLRHSYFSVPPGDDSWYAPTPGDDNLDGGQLRFELLCSKPASWWAQLHDAPEAPAAFTGRTTPSENARSTVAYKVLGTAPFEADVVVTQGAIKVGSETVASRRIVSLGREEAGVSYLSVEALDGPQAHWTVRVRALPVPVAATGFRTSVAPPGVPVSFNYSVGGETNITAVVSGPQGPVRVLASGLQVSGDRSMTWDGTDESARAVPDGTYTLTLTSRDPSGLAAAPTSGAIRIDGTGPSARLIDGTLDASQKLAVDVEDPAGVKRATLTVDGEAVAKFDHASDAVGDGRAGAVRLSAVVAEPGAHTWSLNARDGVGNTAIASGRVSVARQTGTRSCRKFIVGRANSTAYARMRLPARGSIIGKASCKMLVRVARGVQSGRHRVPRSALTRPGRYGRPFALRDSGKKWRCRYKRIGASGPTYAVSCGSNEAKMQWRTG